MGMVAEKKCRMLICALGGFLDWTRVDSDPYSAEIARFVSDETNPKTTEEEQFQDFVDYMSSQPSPVGDATKVVTGNISGSRTKAKYLARHSSP
jgi:hypothetical protein